jgi:hypothetical protein
MLTFSGRQDSYAQLAEKLYATDCRIDTLCKGQLSVEVDNISFFKDNEFNSTVQKGYTLPGFWLQLKAGYYPLSNVKLEAGVHSMWFWGTTRYPAFAYKDISKWNGQDYAHNVHVLPYFRAHISLSDNVCVILGDIYGGSNHRLIEPLYNPELNLTSDPETGLQLLYGTKWLDLDLWVDWMTYIYKLDTRQEAFVTGGSALFKVNSPESRYHVYIPVQGLTQHRGGEIDVTDEDIQTIMNGALGVGLKWNLNGCVLKYINTEIDMAGYIFPKGRTFQLERGRGYYAKAAVQLSDFNISTSYWSCNDFVPIFGSPFYGSVSTKEAGMMYENPKMLYLGADYVRTLGKGFTFGIQAEMYHYLSGKRYSSETGLYQSSAFGGNTNFSIGVCLRINPSFLIKQY